MRSLDPWVRHTSVCPKTTGGRWEACACGLDDALRARAMVSCCEPEALYPHRGGWRHASWCDWERGSETSCSCGLDALRAALTGGSGLASAEEIVPGEDLDIPEQAATYGDPDGATPAEALDRLDGAK